MRLGAVGAVLLFCCALTSEVLAQSVVLVRPAARDPELLDAFNRLGAELRIHHFETTVVDGDLGDDPAAALGEIAEQQNAFASIAFVHRDGRATLDVWLVDRITGKTTIRTIDVSHSRDAASLVAVRAVDLLRTSLQELAPGELPPADVVGASEQVIPAAARQLAAPPEPRWSLQAAALALVAGARFGPAFGPALGVFYRAASSLELGLLAAGPLAGSRLQTTHGAASMREELCWLEAHFPLLRAGRFRAAPLLALGAFFLQAQGQAVAPLQSHNDQVWSALLALGAHAELELVRRVALSTSVRAFGLAPRLGVAVARDSARLTLPSWQLSLGVTVGL
jgi:hypothetical protein